MDAPSCYTRITGNMFTTPTCWRNRFPKLKGKAGQIKHLLPALLYAFDRLRDPTDERQSMIRVALQSSLKVDRIIDQYPGSIRLPREASNELITHGFTYLNTCTLLANRYNVAGDMIFNVTVKAHCLPTFC